MRTDHEKREVTTSGVSDSAEFGISMKDSAHLMQILRDTLYTDRVLAVLREYGANAWDSHRECGKADKPIVVTLPTVLNPTLTIRDEGKGLSHQEVFEVYTQYGASTKRDSDNAVGMLGIGSKSGFAYSDTFMISTWCNGEKRIYTALLDETEKGTINLLHQEKCNGESGVEIQIPVKPEDISEFTTKARELYKYFDPPPSINVDLPKIPTALANLVHGAIFDGGDTGWVALMGCVPYKVDLKQIQDSKIDGGVGEYLNNLSGVLRFNIGDVQVSASREELKYSAATKKALVQKFNSLVEEFVKATLDQLNNATVSLWERRLRAQVFNRLNIPVPKASQSLVLAKVSCGATPPDHFHLTRGTGSAAVTSINVFDDTRLIIRNELKAIGGYNGIGDHDHIVQMNTGHSLADARAELEKKIVEWGIEGISWIDISAIPWSAPMAFKSGRKVNKKHHVKTFKMKKGQYFHAPWSDNWVIEKRVPTPDDVFVILTNFQSVGHDLFSEWGVVVEIAGVFGARASLPEIYGYKTTSDKPVTPDKCMGIHFPVWKSQFIKSLITDEAKREIQDLDWSELFRGYQNAERCLKRVSDGLGASHPLTQLVWRWASAVKKVKPFSTHKQNALRQISDAMKDPTKKKQSNAPKRELSDIMDKYPLMNANGGLEEIMRGDDKSPLWFEHIKMMDNKTEQRSQQHGWTSELLSDPGKHHRGSGWEADGRPQGCPKLPRTQGGIAQREVGRCPEVPVCRKGHRYLDK